jgi:hypothetical protein
MSSTVRASSASKTSASLMLAPHRDQGGTEHERRNGEGTTRIGNPDANHVTHERASSQHSAKRSGSIHTPICRGRVQKPVPGQASGD